MGTNLGNIWIYKKNVFINCFSIGNCPVTCIDIKHKLGVMIIGSSDGVITLVDWPVKSFNKKIKFIRSEYFS